MISPKPSILALAALLTTSLAAPAPSHRAAPVQSCRATEHWLRVSYSVYIPVPYAGGAACARNFQFLEDERVYFTNWRCAAAGDGNTQLRFTLRPDAVLTAGGIGAPVNRALGKMYPDVRGGFHCPDE